MYCCVLQVMHGGVYMAALLRLTAHPSEAVIRRALKLLTTSLASISQHDVQVCTRRSSVTAHLMFMSMLPFMSPFMSLCCCILCCEGAVSGVRLIFCQSLHGCCSDGLELDATTAGCLARALQMPLLPHLLHD